MPWLRLCIYRFQMDILHAYWNTIVLVDIMNLVVYISLPICSSHPMIRYHWLKEAQSVHFGVISFNMTSKKYMVLAKAVSYDHHILGTKAIKADVKMKKRKVCHQELSEFPGWLGALKLVPGMMSKLCSDVLFFLNIVLNNSSPDRARSHWIKGKVKDLDCLITFKSLC